MQQRRVGRPHTRGLASLLRVNNNSTHHGVDAAAPHAFSGFKHNIVRRPLRPLTATTLTTAPSSKTEILVDDASFKRPAVDSRQYRLLKLANGLEVALVSDRDADEAGAALSVKAGSFDDTLLGLAHFHEHMLFWERGNTRKKMSTRSTSSNGWWLQRLDVG